MELEVEKERLRRSLGARLRGITAEQAAAAADAICRELLAALDLGAGRRVGLYAALPDEVPTRPLFDALTRAGVACLFPRVSGDRQLVFARVARWEELRVGEFGVLAPGDSAATVELGELDFVFVPGVAFDRRGARLGRGAGCYDRTFSVAGDATACLCGVAFEIQVEDSIPTASHDRTMDAIVTEHGFRWTRGEHP